MNGLNIVPVVSDLESVLSAGARHAVFGAFLDIGSFGSVIDVSPGQAAAPAMLGPALNQAAQGAAFRIAVHGVLAADACEAAAEGWHELVRDGGIVALVILDAASRRVPVWLLAGSALPAMGDLGACKLEDLWHTWLKLAGGRSECGRFLLEEQDFRTPAGQVLAERLRDLYGD
jgi:hypothetical protein